MEHGCPWRSLRRPWHPAVRQKHATPSQPSAPYTNGRCDADFQAVGLRLAGNFQSGPSGHDDKGSNSPLVGQGLTKSQVLPARNHGNYKLFSLGAGDMPVVKTMSWLLLLLGCLTSCLAPANGEVLAIRCPDRCDCLNASSLVTPLPSVAYPAADPGAFDAINCSSVGLATNEVQLIGGGGDGGEDNQNSTNDGGEVVVSQQLERLDLSYNSLTSVNTTLYGVELAPNITLSLLVRHLDLSHNQIVEILNGEFSMYKGVTSIDLSNNHLQHLDTQVFQGLETVTRLNLSHNALQDVDTVAFRYLPQLQILDLSYNNLQLLSFDTLHELSSLQYLYLHHNNLKSVTGTTYVFPPLPFLVCLDMSNNPIGDISSGMFQHLNGLVNLHLDNCSLLELSEHSLAGLHSLEVLSLNHNNISALSFPVFKNTSLTTLSLAVMPHLSDLSHNAFLGLSQLVHLNMSHNPQLSFLQPNLLTPLIALSVLDLSSCGLTQVSEITFRHNENLEKVYMQDNPFTCSCINAWFEAETHEKSSKFVDVHSLQCSSENGKMLPMKEDSFHCQELTIHNMSDTVHAKLGSQLLLSCQYAEVDEAAVVTWITPWGERFYHHNYHPDASDHLLTPYDIQPDSEFHKGHYWHNSNSYYSELSDLKDRVVILSDGSLYIDYLLRSDTGIYTCKVSNAHYNHTAAINMFLKCTLSSDIKIFGFLVGLLCALTFFTLNVIYVIISWVARRLVNKRRREIISQMLENLNTYKSTQISKIQENYTYQLNRVRNQYHIQRDRLHKNYNAQVDKMKRGCSNQVERVRDNYNCKLTQLRDYSSNQILQIRERANNQIVRIRDYGSLQLDKLRETYKLQQQHVLKLLDTMNLDNCRNVVETECMRTESIMFDIDLLGDDERTDSPVSNADSEFDTANCSPASSMDDSGANGGFTHDIAEAETHARQRSSGSSDDNGIIIEMQTTIDMEGGIAVDVAETWKYDENKAGSRGCGDDDDTTHSYTMNVRSPGEHGNQSLLQLRTDPSLFNDGNILKNIKLDIPLPTLDLEDETCEKEACERKDSAGTWDGEYATPDASPTKVWPGAKGLPRLQLQQMESDDETDQTHNSKTDDGLKEENSETEL